MSIVDYDVVLPLTYDNTRKHNILSYSVAVPYFMSDFNYDVHRKRNYWDVFLNFDEEDEKQYYFVSSWDEVFYYPTDSYGIFDKAYFRNPHRDKVTFTNNNCSIRINYGAKASFQIKWNIAGYVASSNAWFKCSSMPMQCLEQYTWTSATVYYKESTDSTYQSVAGIITGTWSDYTIQTNLSFSDNVVYDIYIEAESDDGQISATPVEQFTTNDGVAIASCIAPSGSFLNQDVTFVWSHATIYGTPQYAYDLQYSNNNGSSWTIYASHAITENTSTNAKITDAGVYLWRVRTYNSNDLAGEWASASFVNNVPANPPTNLSVSTKGRPTVSWASISQTAYQVQMLLNGNVVYDSGAVYSSETSHFVNQYLNDNRAYIARVRIYNALGEISEWVETGYQQPSVTDVSFSVEDNPDGGAKISFVSNEIFTKYYILRNNRPIAMIPNSLIAEGAGVYIDNYAVGLINYSVVGVTSEDQSDIQSIATRVFYPSATLISSDGQKTAINKRVDVAYEIKTDNEADINKTLFIGDDYPTHYSSSMRLKSFTVQCFDEQGVMESLLGTLVYYADNFANGGWCIVTAYEKKDNFIKNSNGVYANEVSLTLEVTNYDDSIKYAI